MLSPPGYNDVEWETLARRAVVQQRHPPLWPDALAPRSATIAPRALTLLDMNSRDENEDHPATPDAVLATYTRVLSDAHRAKLVQAYVDPRAAYDGFRAEAGRVGPAEAAIGMREDPARFGALREGGAQVAGEAAMLGARAYHARIAQSDIRIAAEVMDGAFADAIRFAGGQTDRVRSTWDALTVAYGARVATSLITERSQDVFGPEASPESVGRVVAFATARDTFRVRAGAVEPAGHSQPLPRTIGEEQQSPNRLPEELQRRLLAASDGLRQRLSRAYDDPLAAEARLHTLIQRDPAAIESAEQDPSVLGPIRHDHPGGPVAAEATARSALAYARIAYEYHLARFPDAAEEIAARDAVQAIRNSARDTDRAMHSVHEAIHLRGPALDEYLGQNRSRPPGHEPGRGGPDQGGGAPGTHDPGVDSAPRRPANGSVAASESTRASSATTDPEVDRAVRAAADLEAATNLTETARRLRDERTEAERMLAILADQDSALYRTTRDFNAVAKQVYDNPDGALKRWEKLVQGEGGHLEQARDRVISRPELLGTLRSEPQAGTWGKFGFRSTRAAREAVPRLASRATAYTQAERKVHDPVEWTTPEGEAIRGRDGVRAAALTVSRDREDQITAADGRIREIGGVRATERNAQQALARLSPEQRERAKPRLGPRAASLLSTARQAADLARNGKTLAEGPAGL